MDKFYTVVSLLSEGTDPVTKVIADISIDSSHPIFEGHFPGQPILPGVCMMQIVRELITTSLGSPLRLTEASSIKFLRIINPFEHKDLKVEIMISAEGSGYGSTSRIYHEDITFFSMKAVFQASFFTLP